MKGKRYKDIEDIQSSSTDILKSIPINELQKSFDNLIVRAKHCIESEGEYFEGN